MNNFKWKIYNYRLNNILTPTDIYLAGNKFYSDELTNTKPELKFAVLFKIKIAKANWINIYSLQILDKTKIEDLKEIFKSFLMFKSDSFKGLIIENIIFRYRFLEFDIESILKYPTDFYKWIELLPEDLPDLPSNRLFQNWGDHLIINGDNTYIVYDHKYTFHITELENEYFIWLTDNGLDILYFHDIYDTNDTNTFIRTIGNL